MKHQGQKSLMNADNLIKGSAIQARNLEQCMHLNEKTIQMQPGLQKKQLASQSDANKRNGILFVPLGSKKTTIQRCMNK